jgi:DNA-binding beta-propeller fold protein YncE
MHAGAYEVKSKKSGLGSLFRSFLDGDMSMNARSRRLTLTTLVSLCAVVGGLLFAGAPALAVQGHIFSGAFGSKGSGEGRLSEPSDIAVNETTGDVYVADSGNSRVEYFTAAGAYAGQFNGSGELPVEERSAPTGRFSTLVVEGESKYREPLEVAVDNDPESPSFGDVYVADTGHGVIDKFSATGAYIGQLSDPAGEPSFWVLLGVAVDPNGVLWVSWQERGESPYGSLVSSFGNAKANEFLSSHEVGFSHQNDESGFAVDSNDDLFVVTGVRKREVDGSLPEGFGVAKLNSSGEILTEELDSLEGTTGVAADLSNNELFIDSAFEEGQQHSVTAYGSTGALLESFGSAQLTQGSGLAATRAGEVYVADLGADRVDRFVVEGPSRPTVEGEAPLEVAGTSATLSAQLKPTGPDTTYWFQYGTVSCAAAPASCSDLPAPPGYDAGAGFNYQSVSVHPQDLQPDTLYHFRLVATNELGTTEGAEATFTTQTAGTGFALPDGRVWEMISPPDKLGAGFFGIGAENGAVFQASQDGGAFTYAMTAPPVAGAAGSRSLETTQVLSTRVAPGEWETRDIVTPHTEGASTIILGYSSEYMTFSSDLSLGLLQPGGDTPLPPLAAGSEPTIYLRGAGGEYTPLVTAANVPPGTKFDEGKNTSFEHLAFEAATPDLSHVVLHSNVPLTKEGSGPGLYEWAGGKSALVSFLPGDSPSDGRMSGFRHDISVDGSRVVFAETGENLYLRDIARGETVLVDAPQEGAHPIAGEPTSFQAADSGDSRVFFTSFDRLTANASENGRDLYVFEVTSGKGEPLAGKVIDLSVDENTGQSSEVENGVLGAGEDGADVYFVAHGVLGDGAERGAVNGKDNLYMVRYDEAGRAWTAPTFIARLSPKDALDWVQATPKSLKGETSRVSPNGNYLAFMSKRPLTGYDNRDLNGGGPDEEVFLYNAAAGRLVCASCNPTGERPIGLEVTGEFEGTLIDWGGYWVGHRLAANIPGWTSWSTENSVTQAPYLSDSGRLFFNSVGPLVAGDVNGRADVYEYEPAGTPGCAGASRGESTSQVYSAAAGGCVGLISSGTSTEESAFLGASASGGDVFFLTDSRLASQDYDNAMDVYDAHECTAAAPCAPPTPLAPPPCGTGDACKPAPTPQPAVFGAPSSETFTGAGNPAPPPPPAVKPKAKVVKCKKGFVRNKKDKCVRKKSRKQAKRASRDRRASR